MKTGGRQHVNRLDLQTLGRSQPIMPKRTPRSLGRAYEGYVELIFCFLLIVMTPGHESGDALWRRRAQRLRQASEQAVPLQVIGTQVLAAGANTPDDPIKLHPRIHDTPSTKLSSPAPQLQQLQQSPQ